MKRKKMLEALELLDNKYIAEAEPSKSRKSLKLSIIAACACITILSVSLWLFVPFRTTPPDVSRYKNSEYYNLISTLNKTTFSKPKYKNNFEKLISNNFLARAKAEYDSTTTGDAEEAIPNSAQNYVETTDNQETGIVEADLIKRSDKYIYYLCPGTLCVYTTEGDNTRLAGNFLLPETSEANGYYVRNSEFYLSADCRTVTVIRDCLQDGRSTTEIFSLDVSEPAGIKEKNRAVISGAYVTSRLTDGKLILVSSYRAKNDADFSNLEEFVPYIDTSLERNYVSPDKIYIPEDNLTGNSFVVVFLFDEVTLKERGSYSFFTYYTDAYVSDNSVYLFRNYTERVASDDIVTRTVKSDISRLCYKETLEYLGNITIPGSILNQYSLDEKDGILRVFTSTSKQQSHESYHENGIWESYYLIDNSISASLFLVDLESMQITVSVENFAPEGESVRSARFKDDTAYVCTAIEVTDPVFFFDLSDISNITYKHTDTIEGFSTSLIELDDGYLLGIGVSDLRSNFKAEIYRESESGVIPVCKYEIENSSYSQDYKSYFIDRKKGLVGLGITQEKQESEYSTIYMNAYLLLHFDGERLAEVIFTDLPGDNRNKRAVLIDGYFYMFSDEAFKVQKTEY